MITFRFCIEELDQKDQKVDKKKVDKKKIKHSVIKQNDSFKKRNKENPK